jgi:deoxyribose-phosphate aldolase
MASTAETAGTNISPQTTESAILVGDFLAANPKLSSTELGAPKIMTDRYTNQEWKKQIEETQRKVKVEDGKKYEAPGIGSKEFAETIDHTLLKLDATAAQIDALCAEARTEGFKVGAFFHLLVQILEECHASRICSWRGSLSFRFSTYSSL